jgi:cold shock CspA family protein
MHVREAQQRIAGEIPWLCDSIGNDVMHALGNAPTSEFVIDPDGKIVRKRAWGNARELRKDLEKLAGPVEKPTSADDLDVKIAPPPKVAARGVVGRIKVPSSMKPLVTRPESKDGGIPHYAKLRADTDEQLLNNGKGKLYLGFHLDPIYRVHWNNLTAPIHVEIELPQGVAMPKTLDGPKVEKESDVDPREFLVDVSGWTSDEPLRLTVRYFGCSDEPAFCVPVTQHYTIHRKLDIDSGWARGRVDPTGSFQPAKPKIAEGRVVKIDEDAGRLSIKSGNGKTLEFLIDRETHFQVSGKRRPMRELKPGAEVRVSFYVRDEGPLARELQAKADVAEAESDTATTDTKPEPSSPISVFGYVIGMDVEKRILTFKTEAGKEMKVRIAKDVNFRRLDGKPNKLETLEEGHKVRVEYEPADGEIPLVKNLLARVLDNRGARAQPAPSRPRDRGAFKARDKYNPRRAIVDAPFLKASEVTDQVTDNELVLGVEIDGQPRAYPINMLTGPSREIINDTLGEAHLAATW